MRTTIISLFTSILTSIILAACGAQDHGVETVVELTEGVEARGAGENIIFENWIEHELDVEIIVETDSIGDLSSIHLKGRDGDLIETVSGESGFGMNRRLDVGDRVMMDCAPRVRCTPQIRILSKEETFIDSTEFDCGNPATIYSHGLDSDLDLVFKLEVDCENESGMTGLCTSSLINTWVDENGNNHIKEIFVFNKTKYTKTVKGGQGDTFTFMCCGDSGDCAYEVMQIIKE